MVALVRDRACVRVDDLHAATADAETVTLDMEVTGFPRDGGELIRLPAGSHVVVLRSHKSGVDLVRDAEGTLLYIEGAEPG